ncbi:adenosylcobinamide-GDP ribazoletransferase [Yinghuangia sp. ASG 101]|uniref:adenosylcobinamide-GDP ribazoletransferase n=1 Tax=Yinghuangia sp. ASG 101 TaxID=2896848 RepID=UPI001E55F0C1|nr:adenosylcobinamide-GDP ribazoletransferase [Yinghuangia sp. ASG 101]UGQ09962.1 adenosylcobinamide-GDP ribazoletransferase [Yinghuangia sp. ASG 101]
MSGTSRSDGLRLAFGTLSVLPVRVPHVDRSAAARAMAAAPLVGVVLGGLAAGVLAAATYAGTGPLLAAVLALGALALLTRGLHLDGLADVADGLGSGRPAADALRVMKASDIGPFGVLTLVFTLLAQTAALARIGARHDTAEAVAALVIAVVCGRVAIGLGCLRGVPSARPGGLGAMVAGTLRPAAVGLLVVLLAASAAGLGAATELGVPRALFAVVLALLAATALLWHVVRRIGGITGDVLGAAVETATAVALVVLSTG